jgi:hypothetical protein
MIGPGSFNKSRFLSPAHSMGYFACPVLRGIHALRRRYTKQSLS